MNNLYEINDPLLSKNRMKNPEILHLAFSTPSSLLKHQLKNNCFFLRTPGVSRSHTANVNTPERPLRSNPPDNPENIEIKSGVMKI